MPDVNDTEAALKRLVDLAEEMSGQFKPEFELGYWAGVPASAECWWVRFEGDIRGCELVTDHRSLSDFLCKFRMTSISYAITSPAVLGSR
jgi:hypothetical protein